MEQIKDIINSVIKNISSGKRKVQEEILKTWEDVLGKRAAKHTKIMGIHNGKLFVNVDSSVWLFQLNLKRNYLLGELRKITDDVEEINFRIGRVK